MLLTFHSSKFISLKGVLLPHCKIVPFEGKRKFLHNLREQFETFPMLNKDVLGVYFLEQKVLSCRFSENYLLNWNLGTGRRRKAEKKA